MQGRPEHFAAIEPGGADDLAVAASAYQDACPWGTTGCRRPPGGYRSSTQQTINRARGSIVMPVDIAASFWALAWTREARLRRRGGRPVQGAPLRWEDHSALGASSATLSASGVQSRLGNHGDRPPVITDDVLTPSSDAAPAARQPRTSSPTCSSPPAMAEDPGVPGGRRDSARRPSANTWMIGVKTAPHHWFSRPFALRAPQHRRQYGPHAQQNRRAAK